MTAYYNEIDKFCAAWLRNLIAAGHIAPGDVDERDIRDIAPNELKGYTQCHFFAGIGVWSYALRCAGWPDSRPAWTGSCPCQPFSAAGRGGGFADERHLWPHWHHLIRECRPPVVLGEQVASKDGLVWFDLVHADMEGLDYAIGAVPFPAAGIGAPHIRQRLYFVADADEGRGGRNAGAISGAEEEAERRVRGVADGSESRGAIGELGHPDDARPQGRGLGGNGAHQRPAGPSGVAGIVADADGGDASAEGLQRGGQHRQQPQDGRAGGGMEHAASQQVGLPGRAWKPGSIPWSECDWVPCTDGKARPVEPGAFPLAHGAPARVGRLRAYGNSLVAPQAEAFIRAYCVTRAREDALHRG